MVHLPSEAQKHSVSKLIERLCATLGMHCTHSKSCNSKRLTSEENRSLLPLDAKVPVASLHLVSYPSLFSPLPLSLARLRDIAAAQKAGG